MALIVQKYGGSSVGSLDRIHHVANKIIAAKAFGHQIVVVVSAMYGETDRLIQLAHALTANPEAREFDLLISTGEQVSIALLSMALNSKGCPSRAYTGQRVGIFTDKVHTKARIQRVDTKLMRSQLEKDRVVIVAGFQGITEDGEVTTLGRGGSDTTAVAIAAALKADECQIFTDVDGVYTTDPHFLASARLLSAISFEEMLEMASLGAKVLQMRAVELASKHKMPIRVLSTFSDGPGTLVTFKESIMSNNVVSGITFSREEALLSINEIPLQLGIEGLILEKITAAQIDIDMLTQNSTENAMDFSFTVARREFPKALSILETIAENLNAAVKSNTKIAKLSLVGLGMRSHPSVAMTLFKTLGAAGVNVQMISTSEIRISVVIDEMHLETSIKAIHDAFQLDKVPMYDIAQIE